MFNQSKFCGVNVPQSWASITRQFCKDGKAAQCHDVWTIEEGQTSEEDLHENHSMNAGQHGRRIWHGSRRLVNDLLRGAM